MSATVVVVGGGAAGLIAAWRAAESGHRVILLEANERLGTKLRISGGGKCNVTHDGSIQAFLSAFRKEQARFLRPALHAFPNEALLEVLHRAGVMTYVRENGRVFPVDRPGSAEQVVEALLELVRHAGVEVRTGLRVTGLSGALPSLESLNLADGQRIVADTFILATGGASYPQTGTSGEALDWFRELGVPISPWFPALAPVPLKTPRPEWEGTALRGGALCLHQGQAGKRLARCQDDILFTRMGISGPAALELSREIEACRRAGHAWLSYAFDQRNIEQLDAELRTEQNRNPHLAARTWLQKWLPERLCVPVVESLGLPKDQRLKDLPRAGRHGLVESVLFFPLGEPGTVPLSQGEVSAGGVCLDAVDPQTLLVKGWENLRVCGELLNVDGPVGGYNLQAAFSTGFLAGNLVIPSPS